MHQYHWNKNSYKYITLRCRKKHWNSAICWNLLCYLTTSKQMKQLLWHFYIILNNLLLPLWRKLTFCQWNKQCWASSYGVNSNYELGFVITSM